MRWSELHLKTLRENPADAEMESHRLLVRGGYIRKLAPGIFTYGPLMVRAIRKLEEVIREELARVGCQEILMPMVQPASLWQQSGRWPHMGELLKFKNKNQQEFCLGATHEEVVVDFMRAQVHSYRDLPMQVFQIQTKYRDEIRPRFGLMRGREFLMKDAYSFDRSEGAALQSYENMKQAYQNIFSRLGVEFTMVQADSGAIGGDTSHEFQVLADHGMDQVLTCKSCGYSANVEVAPKIPDDKSPKQDWTQKPVEELATPGAKTIEDLSQLLKKPASELAKSFFVKFQDDKGQWQQVTLLLPGDREVNFVKVKSLLKAASDVEPLSDAEVKKLTGSSPGSCGPVGLSTPVVMDPGLEGLPSLTVGANKEGFHLLNVVPGRDFKVSQVADISVVVSGDPCPSCGQSMEARKGIEVGHIFYLGTKYSRPMGLEFLDESGKAQAVEMGCYGIGVTRTLQAIVEQKHDKDGIVWPRQVAPFDVHVCCLDPDDTQVVSWLESYQGAMESRGFSVFIDDRSERPGVKFKDADLLGLPLRVVVGRRGMERGEVELFIRHAGEKLALAPNEALTESVERLRNLP